MSNHREMTRRQFIRNSAIAISTGAAAVTTLNAGAPNPVLAAPIPKKWDREADVIVVGSGPTGLPAAIAAVDRGASVVVLEQSKEIGGCWRLPEASWISGAAPVYKN
jgi:NADPH-dependent 2,4-dienoyl-CoA reductase/sulfur reductase-like enzyme